MSEAYPKRTAIIYLGESFSYRRLRDLSERFAGALVDSGFARRPGDGHIANSVQWVLPSWGFRNRRRHRTGVTHLHLA